MTSQDKQYLNFLQWNANSLLNRIHELYLFMNVNHIDLACISETFYTESDNIPSHPNFAIYRFDRQELSSNNRSGGVAIIIRRSIKHQLVSNLNTKLLENIGLEINLQNGSRIQIFSVYLPGGANNETIRQHYKHDIQLLTNRNCSYFVLGDLNSRHRLWNCSRANTAGNILFNLHQRNPFLIYHPNEPTFFPTQNNYCPSYIDLGLTNGIHQIVDSTTFPSSSDHQMITHKIETTRTERANKRLIPLFKKAN